MLISKLSRPYLAFQNNALLHSLCATSALHLARLKPEDEDARQASQSYLNAALTGMAFWLDPVTISHDPYISDAEKLTSKKIEHSNDVDSLNEANAEAVCFTSSLIRLCTFAVCLLFK